MERRRDHLSSRRLRNCLRVPAQTGTGRASPPDSALRPERLGRALWRRRRLHGAGAVLRHAPLEHRPDRRSFGGGFAEETDPPRARRNDAAHDRRDHGGPRYQPPRTTGENPMNVTRRTVLTAISAAAAAQAQRPRVPNWKPKLGVLCGYTDENLAFVKA